MMRALLLALSLALTSAGAFAAESRGEAAVRLAALIGTEDPVLSHAQRHVLSHFLSGMMVSIPPASRRMTIRADRIRCNPHDCTLTFGHRDVTRAGRTGQKLRATLKDNGARGTADTITVTDVTCTVDATQVEIHGVDARGRCTFTNGN